MCEQSIKNTNKYNILTSQWKYSLNNIATRKITKLLQFHKTMTKILQNEIASFVYLFNRESTCLVTFEVLEKSKLSYAWH